MSAFDKIIGYKAIKEELLQVCDMIHNSDMYRALGAKMPRGILIHGEPGLGKTLMAKCFIAESGLTAYTIRRSKGTDDFVSEIADTFHKAKEQAPAIVFLDDIDKFANEDDDHRDAKEYVAVQSGIDEVSGAEVFVLATANDIDKLPTSLWRSGRFDRKIQVLCPSPEDSREIIKYYLKDKKVSADVNLDDIANMISYNSCAELETVLNEAAIRAAFHRKEHITREDLVEAVLRMVYEMPDDCIKAFDDNAKRVALHEAGHLVISEVLCPGSIGLASLRTNASESSEGFVRRCKTLPRRPYHILLLLGGKAAVELYYADTCSSGCQSDIRRAADQVKYAVAESGSCGFGLIDIEMRRADECSESLKARRESVVQAELEHYLLKARDILLKNKEFLEKATDALLHKRTLLYSDIKNIRDSVTVTTVEI